MAEQDVVVRVAKSLKLGQGVLRAGTQHLQDVAALTMEVVELRARVSNLQADVQRRSTSEMCLRGQLDDIVGRTDRLGFGQRMI